MAASRRLSQKGQTYPGFVETLLDPCDQEGVTEKEEENFKKIDVPTHTGAGWYGYSYKMQCFHPSGETWASRSGDSGFLSQFWLAATSPSLMVFQKMVIAASRFMGSCWRSGSAGLRRNGRGLHPGDGS